jgi:hypothetical protein
LYNDDKDSNKISFGWLSIRKEKSSNLPIKNNEKDKLHLIFNSGLYAEKSIKFNVKLCLTI